MLGQLLDAADAAEISVEQVAENILATLEAASVDAGASFAGELARPVVICDVDGVLCRFVEGACSALYGQFGSGWTYPTWTTYRGPLTPSERAWLYQEAMLDDRFWLTLAPDSEAVAAMEHVADEHVTIVSSERDESVRQATVTWLEQHGVTYSGLHLVGEGGKVALCQEWAQQGAVVLVDDNPARWVDCAVIPNVTVACPRTPYTPDPDGYPSVEVFDDWGQISRMLSRVSAAEILERPVVAARHAALRSAVAAQSTESHDGEASTGRKMSANVTEWCDREVVWEV